MYNNFGICKVVELEDTAIIMRLQSCYVLKLTMHQ